MSAVFLLLGKPERFVFGLAGLDLLALPLVIIYLVMCSRRKP
jgi:hypothetical protein